MKKKILLIFISIFVLIQFYRPSKNESLVVPDTDFIKTTNPPQEIAATFKQACYDCHSNNTAGYLWVDNIAPVSWWVAHHIKEAKGGLNFSKWADYDAKKRQRKLGACQELIEKHKMPLKSYTWMHPKARLSNLQRQELVAWIKKQEK